MADNPYLVVGSPNYSAPIVDLFGNNNQQKQQGQQGQPGQNFAQTLTRFLQGYNGQALAPGSAVPGATGPTSVGGATGPTPLMASGGSPMMNSQGMGLY